MGAFTLLIGVIISRNDLEIVKLKKKRSPKSELVKGPGAFLYPNGGCKLVLEDKVTGEELLMPFAKIVGKNTITGREQAKKIINKQTEDLIKAFGEMKEEK